MHKVFNKDGFIWWIGVVEDRMDPQQLGRVRIRIFGYHTDNKQLLPTEKLPWAWPIQPITSAAISGVGTTPLGSLPGTWVIGFFLDGEDMQVPAYWGTIASTSGNGAGAGNSPNFQKVEEKPPAANAAGTTLKDGSGNNVSDGSGAPIQTGTPPPTGWSLGQTSEKYESGGRGPGTINDYSGRAAGDLGGASYGTYQLASYLPTDMSNGRKRPSGANSPVIQFVRNSRFKDTFKDLTPGTAAFDSKWKEVASSRADEFKKDQHDYVENNYYKVMIAGLQRQGLDLSKFGPAVQDLVWSTAVQLGPAKTSIFLEPLKGKSALTDKDIVELVSAYKIANVNNWFTSSSADIKAGVKNRWESERTALLKLIKP